jgi:hypothetical protein
MRKHLRKDWKARLKRLWRHPLALVIATVAGLYSVWPAFEDVISPFWLAGAAVVMSVTLGVAAVVGVSHD